MIDLPRRDLLPRNAIVSANLASSWIVGNPELANRSCRRMALRKLTIHSPKLFLPGTTGRSISFVVGETENRLRTMLLYEIKMFP
jgi:hypothetical protein